MGKRWRRGLYGRSWRSCLGLDYELVDEPIVGLTPTHALLFLDGLAPAINPRAGRAGAPHPRRMRGARHRQLR